MERKTKNMNFELTKALQILERTPRVVETLVKGLDEEWIINNEGGETWNPYVVVGHLLWADKTDWMPRMKVIIDKNSDHRFPPFDRFGQFEDCKERPLDE